MNLINFFIAFFAMFFRFNLIGANSLFVGRKEVIQDGNGENWKPNSNVTIKAGIYQNKRNLAHILFIEGQIKVELPTSKEAPQAVKLQWKEDYLYNLFENFQINLNGTIQVKDTLDLRIFRYWNALYNRGKFAYEKIPTECIVMPNQSVGYVKFSCPIVIPYAIYDMLGAPQCNIPTWFFQTFNITFKNATQDAVLDSTAYDSGGAVISGGSVSIDTCTVNPYAKYFITQPIEGNAQQILEGLGKLLVTKFISKNFGGGGTGQYIDLPNFIWARDYTIILRNSVTKRRIPLDVIDRIRVADGNFVLVDTKPDILINDLVQRFSLSKELWEMDLADSPDGVGTLHGVLPIYTNYFGDMNNSLVYKSLNQPRITFDFNNSLAQYLAEGEALNVEVYSTYMETPTAFETIAQGEAQRIAQIQSTIA